ncbi:MarR family winged helix-turn-helix transcriptional regulator [Paraburkholderia antibiotica]|uniref:MarR family transcriptional regulator n=1 Tax=Paraburkholderia antibiotica TaxID=2728839 RepID=A0A7Y0A2V4_9BURK|nr:MarR family transcriptional regulator [Paraburkholderia antibiotica]NML35413.1 MarR family transcriptional regulator [Paraburkholderia antibiotica]
MSHSHTLPPTSDFKAPKDIDDFLVLRLRRVAVTAAEGPAYMYEHTLGIGRRDVRILGTIRRNPNLSLKALSEQLNISAVLVSRYISELSARNLVRKTRSPDDTRLAVLALTPAGEAIYAQGLQLGCDFNRDLAACLNDEEAKLLDVLLRRIEERAAGLSEQQKERFMSNRKC